MTEPDANLNPVRMEHRLTTIEQGQLRLGEQVADMALQQRETKTRVAQVETALRGEGEERRRDTVTMTDRLDTITDGIAQRIKMEAAAKLNFDLGKASVTVKMPWRQVFTIMGMILGIIVSAEAAVRYWM